MLSINWGTPFYGIFLDSGLRRNDGYLAYFVIPAKAGIQETYPHLLTIFD
jgi:hypothetical protein